MVKTKVGFADHPARRKVALAAQPHAAAQVLAAKFEVLGAQAPTPRRHGNVLQAQIGVERELGANLGMAAAGHHSQPFRTETLPPDLLRQREEDIDRLQRLADRLDHPPRQRRWCHEPAMADEQRIFDHLPQTTQRVPDRRLGQIEPSAGAGNAGLGVDCIEDDKKVQV
jgi:hypothetical protein